MYIQESRSFWERHEWINSTVVQQMDVFNQNCPTAAQEADPMLLFISMMWRTTVLYMYQLIKSVIHTADEKRSVLADYTRQSTTAAKEIVNLTNKLSQLNSFKASLTTYPYLLITLFPPPVGVCQHTTYNIHILTVSTRSTHLHQYHYRYAPSFSSLTTSWAIRTANSSKKLQKPCTA